jgi:uncharacterized protein (TIGR02172 family)
MQSLNIILIVGVNMEKGEMIGSGNTAEVYVWGENKVLKLFRKDFISHGIEKEYKNSKLVEELGLPVPKVGGIIEEDDRTGIIYEKITGVSMLNEMMKMPWTIRKNAKRLAEIHYRIHQYKLEEEHNYKLKDSLLWNILDTNLLSEEKKEEIILQLGKLPEGNSLLHGDFHPGNIILQSDKEVVLDWMTAASGCPAADVARTLMLLRDAALPTNISGFYSFMIKLFRKHLSLAYLKHYIKLSGIRQEEISVWRIPLAAARLIEWIPEEEKDNLLEVIYQKID